MRTITVKNITLQFDTDGEGTPLQEVQTLLSGINASHSDLDECPFFTLPPDEPNQIEAVETCEYCGGRMGLSYDNRSVCLNCKHDFSDDAEDKP